jgi:hypothetical protein
MVLVEDLYFKLGSADQDLVRLTLFGIKREAVGAIFTCFITADVTDARICSSMTQQKRK